MNACIVAFGQVSPADFKLSGNAVFIDSGCARLTTATYNQSGSLWYQQRIDLNYDFEVDARINLGNIDGGGADGITFSLQPLSNNIGGAGGGIGILGVKPSISVEFDTWQNDDPPYDHIALIRDGNVDHFLSPGTTLQGPFPLLPNQANAEDGRYRPVRFVWNASAKRFQAYYDGVLLIDIVQDLINTVFGGNPYVYWGFTAATGAAINEHTVCLDAYTFVRETDCKSARIIQSDTSLCGTGPIQIGAESLPPFALTCEQMIPSLLNGLVACYPFKGDATDKGGKNYNGTNSGASPVSNRTGESSSAFRFTGNARVLVADNQDLRLQNTDFTVNLWARPDRVDLRGNLIYKGESAGDNFPKYLFEYNNGKIRFHINGPGLNSGQWYDSQNSNVVGWFMATLVKSGSQLSFYMNGKPMGNVPFATAMPNTQGSPFLIGGSEPNEPGGAGAWQGDLDDITIHRRALSSEEVAELAMTKGRYKWSTGDTSQNISVNPRVSTTYYLEVSEGSRQCRDSIRITIVPPPSVDAGPDTSILVGRDVQLVPVVGPGVVSMTWQPPTYLSCTTCMNPVSKPDKPMTYVLRVRNAEGCEAADSVIIRILCDSKGVFIPNTFSPNGDGVNDVFYPRGSGVRSVDFLRIYDRWGNLLFERKGFKPDDKTSGWDGTYRGKTMSPGLYVYTARMICDSKNLLDFKGGITIIE